MKDPLKRDALKHLEGAVKSPLNSVIVTREALRDLLISRYQMKMALTMIRLVAIDAACDGDALRAVCKDIALPDQEPFETYREISNAYSTIAGDYLGGV